MNQGKIVCLHCETINTAGSKACIACGAPLPKVKKPVNKPQIKVNPTIEINKQPIKKTTTTAKKVGEDVDKVYRKAWGAYGLFWRTLGEAIVIALVSFGLGIIGGATGLALWGVILGVAFGVIVGFIVKSYLWLLIGTPIGFVVGALLGLLVSVIGIGPKSILFIVFISSALAVFIGARVRKQYQKNIYEKIRPVLGGLGGLLFALLGMGIGLGLSAAINALY